MGTQGVPHPCGRPWVLWGLAFYTIKEDTMVTVFIFRCMEHMCVYMGVYTCQGACRNKGQTMDVSPSHPPPYIFWTRVSHWSWSSLIAMPIGRWVSAADLSLAPPQHASIPRFMSFRDKNRVLRGCMADTLLTTDRLSHLSSSVSNFLKKLRVRKVICSLQE